MPLWYNPITDWHTDRDQLRRYRYGVIETTRGQLTAIHLRPWPKLISWPEVFPVRTTYHAPGESDRCLLYYNQPRRFANFLALKYVVSTSGTSFGTICAALAALDRIAELKGTDALLCDAANTRLSDRLLRRFGWAPHKPQRWRRNFIKRFYGQYPAHTVGAAAS